jgi:hypothetical protein
VGTSLTNNVSDSYHNTCSSAPPSGTNSTASINGFFTSHAPKKQHSVNESSKSMNGRTLGNTSSDRNGSKLGHRRNGSDGPIRSQSSDHVTKPKIYHRKSPSYDKNIYNSLSMNGESGESGGCNGYTDDLQFVYRGSTRWKRGLGTAENLD